MPKMMGATAAHMTPIRLLIVLCLALFASMAAGQNARPANKVVLGRLGQALEPAKIHASMNTRSRVFYRVPAYRYLVVRAARYPQWTQVLLSNGQLGYIQTDAVATLPYEVSMPQRQAPGRQGAAGLSSRTRSAMAGYALNYIGTPYKWGGNDELRGIDCSAFVKEMYGRIGVNLPRTAAQQALVGTPVQRLEDLQPGDRLYFWEHKRNKVGHTGIYLGNGFFVHSSSGRRGVATDDLRKGPWLKLLVAARR